MSVKGALDEWVVHDILEYCCVQRFALLTNGLSSSVQYDVATIFEMETWVELSYRQDESFLFFEKWLVLAICIIKIT